MKTPTPEHFRESLPLFPSASASKAETSQPLMEVPMRGEPRVVASEKRPANTTRDTQHICQVTPYENSNTGGCPNVGAGVLPSSMKGSPRAHARKSDGPNSHKAAQSVTNLGPVRDAILDILSMGDFTDSEIEQWYSDRQKTWGYPLSSPSGLRSRRSELVTMGFVYEVGTGKTKSGRPCAIWALKERKA